MVVIKQIQTEMGESVIQVPRDRKSEFEPIVVPKHQSRGLSIERLVISLYAKGMSVSDIESEMQENIRYQSFHLRYLYYYQ